MFQYFVRSFHLGLSARERPDVVIGTCVHPLAVTAALLLSRQYRVPFVYEITDIWPRSLQELYGLRWYHPVVALFSLLEKLHLHCAQLVIGLLPQIDKYLEEEGHEAKPFVWIPNGVDPTRYTKLEPYDGGSSNKLHLMYVGGFAKAHNLDLLIDCQEHLPDHVRDSTTLHLVGDGPERKRIEERARKRAKIEVIFHGFVPKSDLPHYLSQADAFVCPSLAVGVYRYGAFFLKLYDYFMAGRPIIFGVHSSNNPVKEANAGITVTAGDPIEFAQAITRMFSTHPAERARWGVNGREFILEHFDLNVLTSRLEKALKSAIYS